MPSLPTAADLQHWRSLAEAATPPPWEKGHAGTWTNGRYRKTEAFVRRPEDDVAIASDILDPDTDELSDANAEFIAVARTALPALLALVEAYQPVIEKVLAYQETWDTTGRVTWSDLAPIVGVCRALRARLDGAAVGGDREA